LYPIEPKPVARRDVGHRVGGARRQHGGRAVLSRRVVAHALLDRGVGPEDGQLRAAFSVLNSAEPDVAGGVQRSGARHNDWISPSSRVRSRDSSLSDVRAMRGTIGDTNSSFLI
jgi:hypothetical protein